MHRWSVRVESQKTKTTHTHRFDFDLSLISSSEDFRLITFIVCMSPSFTGVTEVKTRFVSVFIHNCNLGKDVSRANKVGVCCVEVCVELGGVTLSFFFGGNRLKQMGTKAKIERGQ